MKANEEYIYTVYADGGYERDTVYGVYLSKELAEQHAELRKDSGVMVGKTKIRTELPEVKVKWYGRTTAQAVKGSATTIWGEKKLMDDGMTNYDMREYFVVESNSDETEGPIRAFVTSFVGEERVAKLLSHLVDIARGVAVEYAAKKGLAVNQLTRTDWYHIAMTANWRADASST